MKNKKYKKLYFICNCERNIEVWYSANKLIKKVICDNCKLVYALVYDEYIDFVYLEPIDMSYTNLNNNRYCEYNDLLIYNSVNILPINI